MARLLVSPISTPVGRAVGQTFGVDSVQITPTLGNETDPLTPSARVVIGKRISNRAFLTFARALGNSSSERDQVIVLEYDQNDRLGWVITQNGDGTLRSRLPGPSQVLMRRCHHRTARTLVLLAIAVLCSRSSWAQSVGRPVRRAIGRRHPAAGRGQADRRCRAFSI